MNPVVIRILERHRNLLLMSAAMLCGGVAIYAGSRYVNEQVQAERERLAPVAQQMVDVVVANATLDKGDIVSGDTMAIRSVPAEYVSSSVVTPEQFDALVGQRLLLSMRPGEMLSTAAVSSAEQLVFSSAEEELLPGEGGKFQIPGGAILGHEHEEGGAEHEEDREEVVGVQAEGVEGVAGDEGAHERPGHGAHARDRGDGSEAVLGGAVGDGRGQRPLGEVDGDLGGHPEDRDEQDRGGVAQADEQQRAE